MNGELRTALSRQPGTDVIAELRDAKNEAAKRRSVHDKQLKLIKYLE